MAEVLVEPESSCHLTGLGDKERICHGYGYGFPELKVYWNGLESVQGCLDFQVKDECKLARLAIAVVPQK